MEEETNESRMTFSVNTRNSQLSIFFNPNELINGRQHIDDVRLFLEAAEYINVEPDESYQHIREYVQRLVVKTEFLCKGLNPEYIIDAFDTADTVIILGGTKNILPNGNIFGFALVDFQDFTNSIKVDVICSHNGTKGAGKLLIDQIEKVCKSTLFTNIYLYSVKVAIPFYKKCGYEKKDEKCETMCLMEKKIKYGGKRMRTKGGQTKKSRRKNKRKTTRKLTQINRAKY